MFEAEQIAVEAKIRDFLLAQEIPVPDKIQWNPIPFAGDWGISASQIKPREGEVEIGDSA